MDDIDDEADDDDDDDDNDDDDNDYGDDKDGMTTQHPQAPNTPHTNTLSHFDCDLYATEHLTVCAQTLRTCSKHKRFQTVKMNRDRDPS